MRKLKVLDLFSGIGGFSLGLDRTGGFETVAFCEIEEFPQKILKKHWPDVPIYEDVKTLKGSDIGTVDVICGGYPCQPFSTAGRREGQEDDRHLWPEFSRLVDELRPSWVIGENVAGHISMGLDDVLSDLESKGYACRAFVIPACAVDAPHRRDRVWTIGHANGSRKPDGTVNGKAQELPTLANACVGRCGQPGKGKDKQPRGAEVVGASEDVAYAQRVGQPGQGEHVNTSDQKTSRKGEAGNAFNVCKPRKWRPEPAVGRVANGVPDRVDRLKCLGNAVVPQIPEMIGRAILETYK